MQKHLDQRQNLKFLVAEGHTPIECWHRLLRVYGKEETMSKPTVRRWHKRFKEGDGLTPVTDHIRTGCPRTQTMPKKIEAVRQVITTNRRKTCATTGAETQMSRSSAHKILKKELKLSRKVAKFVPRILTEDQKRMRVQCATQNLERLKADPYLLDKLVCGDESPVYLHDPENKFESSAWLPIGSLRPVKALRSRSQKCTMLTVFFDSVGTILVEFTEETIDSDAYILTLRRLCERIRKKRPGMWRGGGWWTDRQRIRDSTWQRQPPHLQHDTWIPLWPRPPRTPPIQPGFGSMWLLVVPFTQGQIARHQAPEPSTAEAVSQESPQIAPRTILPRCTVEVAHEVEEMCHQWRRLLWGVWCGPPSWPSLWHWPGNHFRRWGTGNLPGQWLKLVVHVNCPFGHFGVFCALCSLACYLWSSYSSSIVLICWHMLACSFYLFT